MSLTKTITTTTAIAALAGFTALSFLPAHAAPIGGGSSSTTPTCAKNQIWDKAKRKCVKAEESSGLSDDNIHEAARDLAYHGRYEEALTVLALAENQDDPRILNYRGFATRKLGRVDEALGYYRTALQNDPGYTLAMSYMGEAYLQQGRMAEAQEQLAAIAQISGSGSREYKLLDEAIRAVN